MAPASAFAGYLYISDVSFGLVHVFDVDSLVETATIEGFNSPFGMVVLRTVGYVTNYSADTVSVIDLLTNEIVQTVTVNDGPYGIATSGTGVYVVNSLDHNVSVIDTDSNTVVATISIPSPAPIQIATNGNFAYVTDTDANKVHIINLLTRSVIASVDVGHAPEGGIAFAGTGAYISNRDDDTVSVIDLDTNTVIRTITVGNEPQGVVSADGILYVANNGSGTVSLISPVSYAVTNTFNTGTAYAHHLLSHDNTLFVTKYFNGTVDVLNRTLGTLIRSFTFSGGDGYPFAIAFFDPPDTGPASPTDFFASSRENDVYLTWTNPVDPDFHSVIIRRSTNGYPAGPSDGISVADHLDAASKTDSDLPNGTYYYSIFALDSLDSYSDAAHAIITVTGIATPSSHGGGTRTSTLKARMEKANVLPSALSHTAAPDLAHKTIFEMRTCDRVLHWFAKNDTMLTRVNERLLKRFGFECR